MTRSSTATIVAIAASCLIAGVASAAETDEAREPVKARISLHGLNLATAQGRDRFAFRARHVAKAACAPRGAGLQLQLDSERCVNEMMADATTQLAALHPDDRVQLASTAR